MYVSSQRAFFTRNAEDIRITGIEALDPGLFIPRGEGRDQVLLQIDQIDVAVKWRPVLLAEDQDAIGGRQRARLPGEELPVKNAVIFIADFIADDVQVLGVPHE